MEIKTQRDIIDAIQAAHNLEEVLNILRSSEARVVLTGLSPENWEGFVMFLTSRLKEELRRGIYGELRIEEIEIFFEVSYGGVVKETIRLTDGNAMTGVFWQRFLAEVKNRGETVTLSTRGTTEAEV